MWTRAQQARDGICFTTAGIVLLARVSWFALKWVTVFTFAAVAVAAGIIFICSVRP